MSGFDKQEQKPLVGQKRHPRLRILNHGVNEYGYVMKGNYL